MTIIQFLDVFNQVSVAKYDKDGNILKIFTVPVKMAPKEKSYMWVKDKKGEKVLPLIAVELKSLAHDISRVTNKEQEFPVGYDTDGKTIISYYNPAPYDLNFQVTIIANYIIEIDQILEQILSFFNPHIFIRIKLAELENTAFDLKVIFNSASPDYTYDFQEVDYRWLSWTLDFTVKGYLYKPAKLDKPISYIYREYWMNEDLLDNRTLESQFLSGGPGTGSGYTYSSMTSGGYDDSANLLLKYSIFDSEDYYE
jgi:hypothetical protein